MPKYQDASELRREWDGVLTNAANAALDHLGNNSLCNSFSKAQHAEYREHLEIMLLAIPIMHQRTEQYGVGSWRAIGWKGHLLRVWDKAVRLMNGYWWGIVEPDEKGLDNAVDLINHVTFMARAMDEKNETGAGHR